MNEPSVLDYIKSKIAPWKYPTVEIPDEFREPGNAELINPEIDQPGVELDDQEAIHEADLQIHRDVELESAIDAGQIKEPAPWPWISLLALMLAFFAQFTLEPTPGRSWIPGLVLFLIAITIAVVAYLRGDWELPPYSQVQFSEEPYTFRTYPLIAGLVIALISFFTFGGNRFTLINLALLSTALVLLVWAFWLPGENTHSSKSSMLRFVKKTGWGFRITPWTIIIIAAFVVAAFFRFYRLDQVPPEMNSDHAEKILDVMRVLDGQTMIFFPTNGGREALQFYLVAGLHKLTGTDLNFISLKIITTLAGFLSLPFIYLLGKDLVNRRVGLLAMTFAAVAYWPNVVSRAGMRLPFYILFTSIILYLLLKGIRSGRRNMFILTGIFLGISLYGYSADRILPLLVVSAVLIFLVHKHSRQHRKQVIISTVILIVIAGVLFIPVLRYMTEDPDSFLFRTLSRMGTTERPLPGPAWQLFMGNLGKSLLMFSWNNGEIWPVSVPHRPALDIISGALFILGLVLLLVRYIRQRNWLDLFWLFSIPILLLPSILALAFPAENPNLYRTGGALIPVFLIIGISLDGLLTTIADRLGTIGSRLAWGIAVILLSLSALFSYRLVFDQYYNQYALSSWNSSEMGSVVEDFSNTVGTVDNIWVMAYPHWVDTRLIGMISGYPTRNFVLFPEELAQLSENPGAKLFLIKPDDDTSISMLLEKYPDGWLEEFVSNVETKNFLMYFVPPSGES